jgi:Uma2 family endonuclease
MTAIAEVAHADWTVADLFNRFGPILHRRIRHHPAPGGATEQDVLDIREREHRLYELVDGVLVEKTMGVQESYLAAFLIHVLSDFLMRHDLGFVLGADGMARLAPGLVRIPDVSFISWQKVPDRRIPRVPMLGFAPDLAVEVLSPGNTPQEMERKLQDYFAAGVNLVWYINPANRTVEAFTSAGTSTLLREDEGLSGEPVLPGFLLPLRDLFARLRQPSNRPN